MSTPFAAMGVRGTDFWAGAVEGKYGVPVILDQAEEGTYIDPRTGCPGVPRHWTPAEVDAALSQTSFSLAFAPTQVLPAAAGLAAAVGGFGVSTSGNNNGPQFLSTQPASP